MKNKTFLIVMLLACAVAGALSFQALKKQASTKDIKAQYLKGGDFTLQSQKGDVSLSSYAGQPVVLYFGFTHCPDVCPLGLTVIRDALKIMPEADVAALFVTLDPERDTAPRLAEYLAFFHDKLVGLTGDLESITGIAKQYGTYFMKTAPDEHGAYSVDHTAYFYLIDQNGELVRVLEHNTQAETLARELDKLL